MPAPETLDLHGLDAELSAKALQPEWEKVNNVGRVTRASKIPSSSGSESGEQNLSDADALDSAALKALTHLDLQGQNMS